ncbi:MAG TPA: hypothetical protein VGD62_07000 [Acidobacteriaceae bacterium]
MRLHLALLALLSPLPLHAQIIATSTTAVVHPAAAAIGTRVLVTATITPATGPVSALNGLTMAFNSRSGNTSGTIQNGVAGASIQIIPDISNPSDQQETIDVEFDGTDVRGQGFGPSSTTVTVQELAQGSQLQGAYSLSFQGTAASGRAAAARGTLLADGNGNVTGELDANSSLGAYVLAVTGTYTFFSATQGSLRLNIGQGYEDFALFVPPGAGVAAATLVATGGNAIFGTGVLERQAAPGAALVGSYAFEDSGETACTDCTGHPAEPVRSAGFLALNSDGTLSGVADQWIGATLLQGATLSGTYTAPDAYGRLTLQIELPGASPDQPTHYAAYLVNASRLTFLSIDSHATSILLTGELVR